MKHVFGIISELTEKETEEVSGGLSIATTYAVGEEGGSVITKPSAEEGGRPPVTTYAVGEEGGIKPTTLAGGEEGGGRPITLSLLETGGFFS